MIWKGVGVLGVAAGLVIMFVVALARLTVPDVPTFAEGFEEAAESRDGSIDFVPTAIGGELQISGAREGAIALDSQVGGPTYGLGGDTARIFFDADPLAINQMSYDGLAFFPEPEDCEFTEGRHNEEIGVAAVQVSCEALVDIRDNGTISLQGYLALPANMVIELDVPETGGTLTVGDEDWEIIEPTLVVGPTFQGQGGGAGEVGLPLNVEDPDKGMFLAYDMGSERLTPATILYDGTVNEISGDCTITDEELMVVNPQTRFRELTLDCEDVEIPGVGTVEITGNVVYQEIFFAEP